MQKNISDNGYGDMPNNRFVEIRTTVPSTAMTGHVSLIIDSLIAVSPLNLVVLPDTFPYKPNPPLILTSTSITSTSFISHWNRPYRALGFLLDISIDNFSTFLIGFNSANVTDTLKSISGLLEGTEYRLRIRAYSDTDTSDYSHRITFTIPPAPVALTPRIVGPLEFLVQWSDSRGADGYKLDLSIDHFITHESINVIENSLGIRVLNSELPFFEYRVRAYNTSGISDYSNIINVLVTDAKLRTGEIFLSPNPATDYVNINGMPHQVIESFLIDNLGRVRRVNLQKENNDSLVLDVRTLGEGLYFLQLVTPQSIIQLKFIKL